MAVEWPRRNPRRDIVMFLGFIVLCITTLAIVAIASGSPWDDKQWAAVAAFGSAAQAVGVFGALIYASQQIRVAREAGVRERIEALSDRLESVIYADLQPAIEGLVVAWVRVENYAKFWITADGGEDPVLQHSDRIDKFLRDNYESARKELWTAYRNALKASNAAIRAMRALGHGRSIVMYQVDAAISGLYVFVPTDIVDVDPDELAKLSDRIDRLRTHTTEFINWVNEWVEENAPVVRRPG